MSNSLQELHSAGQSFWLDYIDRQLFKTGKLKNLIQKNGMRGMTSNPTIFEKAISSGPDYDDDIIAGAKKGKGIHEIFEDIAVKDIQKAADALHPIFKESKGKDGFVSLEVSPTLAYNTKATIDEASKLFKRVKRPNLMIKIPGTKEGLPAIEECTARGININITLLFSVDNYRDVIAAYMTGLERRADQRKSIKNIVSVASFFVSRVDSAVDKILDRYINDNKPNHELASQLLHKAAIANAKAAYKEFEESLLSPRWTALAKRGANIQRLLWGSTGTKDKRLSDVVYVEELIGNHTVNTMPPQTADAFNDHGKVRETLTQNVSDALDDLEKLKKLDIDLNQITDKLQQDGVSSFIKSFEDLMNGIGSKLERLTKNYANTFEYNAANYGKNVDDALKKIESGQWIERIWDKDATLWKQDENHQKIIRNSLGWLRVSSTVRAQANHIQKIVADIKKAKFTHVLLLGMGGSSLAPEVMRLTFGKKAGFPDLAILDSTEPASVIERAKRSQPVKTLYIVASKSGSTTEPNAFLSYFYDQVKKKKGQKAGENFIAITDPGTHMEKVGKENKFRHIVLNPSDIGGRYSALSFFGMLPAALMGIDIIKILDRADQMAAACSPKAKVDNNPAAYLGALLGELANRGRDKVTFILSKEISSFATWAEQLIAESTGKEGKGILPIEGEDLGPPSSYTEDRVFVSLLLKGKKNASIDKKLKALEKAGHPTIRLQWKDRFDLGAQFFLWEMATAIAGGIMGINPFDQPNVQESKDLTKSYLQIFSDEGSLPKEPLTIEENGLSFFASNGSRSESGEGILQNFLSHIEDHDYVALLAYLRRDKNHEQVLHQIREAIFKKTKAATTVGFGPRFLHSTGQLHKGGANNGVFIQITANDKNDLPVPGEPFTYSVLKEAQALGDLSALKNKGRRTLRIHLYDVEKGLQKLKQLVAHAG